MLCKVLVVDDEEPIVEEMLEALNDEGYDGLGATDTGAALEILRCDPDVAIIVSDLRMPGKSGLDLIREARAEFTRDFTFILMSGHKSAPQETEKAGHGIFEFLPKPLNIEHFLNVVGRAYELLPKP